MHFNDASSRFGFMALALLVGCSGLIATFGRLRSRDGSPDAKRSLLDYLLVWPLLLGKPSRGSDVRRDARFFTGRELGGWLILLVLIVLAIAFSW